MLCDICKKNNAVIHRIVIINGEQHQQHLCADCARTINAGSIKLPTLIEFLSSTGASQPSHASCGCGCSMEEFTQTSLVGCENCYTEMREELLPMIKRAQGGRSLHVGRRPPRAGETDLDQIKALRTELAQAVEKEEYERAAELRDRIRALESEAKQ